MDIKQIIEESFEDRAKITPSNAEPKVREAVREAVMGLDRGV